MHVTTTDMSLVLLLGPQLRAFAQAGYEVVGVSAPGPYVADLDRWGIPHVPLGHATRAMAPLSDARAMAELMAVLGRLGPDIVHTHNPKPGIYGRLAARAAGVPVVVNTVHGLYAQPDDRRARRALVYGLERLASTCSQAELVQSSEDLDVLARLGVPEAKLTLLGNGVDLARFCPTGVDQARVAEVRTELGVSGDEVVVGAVGRLVREKGYEDLFDAAVRLRALNPLARVVVVGPDDPEKADGLAPAALSRASREGRVEFLGPRRDMEDLYAAFDVYVLASHREGFPRSAMEAAAMGLPVVATDIRGCRQVVDHARTGLLVPKSDPAALAAALAELVADRQRRVAMGQAGRRKAEAEFDQQRVINLTLSTYDRLLGARGRPGGGGAERGPVLPVVP